MRKPRLERLRKGRAIIRMCTYPGGVRGPRAWFRCPRDRLFCGVPIKPSPPNDKGCAWDWNGDAENPSLEPSVDCRTADGGCGWHGFIRKGELVNA